MSAQLQAQTGQVVDSLSLLDDIVARSKVAKTDTEHARAKDIIGELVKEVLDGTVVVSDNLSANIDARIAEIDQLISSQLSEVLHAPEFQKIESSWTGLHYLCKHTSTGERLKIKLLNTSKKDIVKDFKTAIDFDQSALFKKVYEEEFGTFGGSPFGALIGDFEIGRGAEDMYFVEQMSHVAAASHAPFISAASSELFGLEAFTDLGKPRDLAKVFDTVDYAKWKSFRESEDARYVGLTVPRFLGRLPYDPKEGITTEGFNFVEEVDGTDHSKYLWVNTAYALGARLTAAFETYGWCAAIRGVEGGGLVEDLPTHTFKTDDGELALKCPTEVAITDRREKELSDLGFIPLVHCKNTDYAAFFGAQSAQKAKKYDSDAANANAALSAQLQYMFAVCRIAHYMKSMMRDKVGSFANTLDVERYLHNWLMQYVVDSQDASQEIRAQKPLREASVEVSEVPGRPGVYRAVAFVRPHYQLDELSVSLRLVAEMPQGSK
ncbi:type VI secretion system contractile sheath large subunit [Aquabacterium sp.]|jgi:type VI secretion system protein ImpC|uniref:type VI secretion system contractile sheath large subunit n=1 Tax=Aquabacterium sp. TaxID=1872578 RepID=UPI0011D3AFC8|nr:type VI secretion system contractile sheath large subunit [Aquabacterium sp.]MBP6612525.1 type VI secretion system contractile sheath large subunit [Aquabacterium sp.]MBP6615464.1 type VI secretion system contractile sheath large subunit [Aquabacterium sp.]MBP7502626.1 type VI secretion system contractile sheath large subunit [Aquabacterium sp.]MDD2976413.1 type VI secretion system contractile sheath large subunit [Aquabacterium sp.]TXI96459.1 MAG: type VI secretion system contractile sheat